jgi:3-oxosteroid 1-dehydrogenase
VDQFDVIVLGTGAAGLVAAISAADQGASVGLYERSDLVGGTSAMSGGAIWMPNNHHMRAAGFDDSREAALAYLQALSLGHLDMAVAEALVDEGPAAIEWVEQNTPCRFFIVDGYPDYHPEHPGGRPDGGRSLDNEVFSFDELGEWADKIRNQRGLTPTTLSETASGGASEPPDAALVAERLARNASGLGLALVGGLLKGCLDRNIEPRLEHRAVGLMIENGRVSGVRFDTADGVHEVRATRAVVLATGGFEWDEDLTRTFLRGPMTGPASTPTNTGDGLRMAIAAGAELGNMTGAWWVPVSRIPGATEWGAPAVKLILQERTRPRTLMVNGSGKRFCNEAGNYNAMGGVFHSFDPATFSYPNQPAWLIFDHTHLSTYSVLGMPPTDKAPEWMAGGATVAELAGVISVPADALEATIQRFNEHASAGEDPDFGRGRSAYDHFNGDRRLAEPFTTLGPLDTGPFYAIKIESGTLGTNGGPRVDAKARVLSSSGGIVDGLFAAGNVMSSATGMAYGGAGGTLGPAITFGRIAGREAAASD